MLLIEDPKEPAILVPEGEDTFRIKGGDEDEEPATFELDSSGNVVGLRTGGFRFERIR